MTQGTNTITGLTIIEYVAAMNTIRAIRENKIKNAYFEGYEDGTHDYHLLYRGDRKVGITNSWEKSHTKKIMEETK